MELREARRSVPAAAIAVALLLAALALDARDAAAPSVLAPAQRTRGFQVPASLAGQRLPNETRGLAHVSPPPTLAAALRSAPQRDGGARGSNSSGHSAAERFRKLWFPWEGKEAAPRVWVSCAYNKGRSGHELKDVATTFVLAAWHGWTPCFQPWWTDKSVRLFNVAAGLTPCRVSRRGKLAAGTALETSSSSAGDPHDSAEDEKVQKTPPPAVRVVHFRKTTYDGLDKDGVASLLDAVNDAKAAGGTVLVYLAGSTRVHTDQIWMWAAAAAAAETRRHQPQEPHVPPGVFRDVRRALQARLFARLWPGGFAAAGGDVAEAPPISYLEGLWSVNCSAGGPCGLAPRSAAAAARAGSAQRQRGVVVAVHLRRGDIGKGMAEGKWTSKAFAQRLINALGAALKGCRGDVEVYVYTERSGAKDLLQKPRLTGVTKIWSGASWEHDMAAFVTADILVVTNSSMSTWAAQLGTGLVVVPSGRAKHFRFDPLPSHVVAFTSTLSIPPQWAQLWGCPHGPVAPGAPPAVAWHGS